MKFIDEVQIMVIAGKGGDGCLSFRREKYIEYGGPNGGDGGKGGDIYLRTTKSLNTLGKFRYQNCFKAKKGRPGEGSECTGKGGDDLTINIPVGTLVYDADTEELIADLNQPDVTFLIANGGRGGLGNIRFKSSTNRSPRKTTLGKLGETRNLKLELQLLADVGLAGLPNAGKSTFITAVSNARPKIADYPFTTLEPNLGVVEVSIDKSFVVADIPGLIEGASDGVGLGMRFLKHLQRTGLLLHLVDIAPDGIKNIDKVIEDIKIIQNELAKFGNDLINKEIWLIFNKVDLIPSDEQDVYCQDIIKRINWHAPWYKISAATKAGTVGLSADIANVIN